jgi:DNA/RNA endonuclease G (NUC1)
MTNRILSIAIGMMVSFCALSSECPQLYPHQEPSIENTVEICKSFFVVVFDTKNQRPLFSSEMTHNHERLPRTGSFYNNDNPLVVSYTISRHPRLVNGVSYDHGHLTPAADSTTPAEMKDTFDVVNTSPQVSTFNRGAWKKLEEDVRNSVSGNVHIVTGLIYSDDGIIATRFYKIVFLASGTEAYIGDNATGSVVTTIPIDELQNIIGYEF